MHAWPGTSIEEAYSRVVDARELAAAIHPICSNMSTISSDETQLKDGSHGGIGVA